MTAEPCLEYHPPAPADYTMILMHGLGADANDLYPLAPTLAGGRLRVVCPDAPARAVTLNGGMRMRAWYDIVGVNLEDRQDSVGVGESREQIERLISAEKQRGFAADKIFLAGFSQGAAMALYAGLRHPQTLAGIVALSGYLLFAERANELRAADQRAPIFQTHGRYDPVVLPHWARNSRDELLAQKRALTYAEYDAAHTISAEMITDLNQWLADII